MEETPRGLVEKYEGGEGKETLSADSLSQGGMWSQGPKRGGGNKPLPQQERALKPQACGLGNVPSLAHSTQHTQWPSCVPCIAGETTGRLPHLQTWGDCLGGHEAKGGDLLPQL